jgi:glycerophosphoryl diester phosphodiesterase
MRISVFQPPYPKAGTTVSAEKCLGWMRVRLDGLEPGEQDLVLLPEYATAPGLNDRQLLREFAESRGADFLQAVAASAKRLHSLIVLAGPVSSGARWFNRTLVFDTRGDLAFTYDKIHLTDVEKDDLGLTPGAKPTVFQHAEIRIGFATCFDIYFPEHFEALAAQCADIVLCPSYQRSESAERICLVAQARALDGGTYLIRSSHSMGDPAVGGRSLVATPAGTLLADAGKDACVVTAELDPKRKFVKPASHGRPAVEHRALIESHRRPVVYRELAQRSQQLKASPFPHLCAHRGLSQACPENTLPAFAAALSCGAHELEFDLWTSRDGVPVVCHDESVDRTTNGVGRVAELSWREIRSMDAGIRFGKAWEGTRVPRLEEVLDLTDRRIGLNIHIKGVGPDGSTIKRVCDLLSEHALLDIAYVALDTESSLRIAREYAPDVPRACLVSQDDFAKSIAIAKRYACQRIQFFRQVTKKQIEQAHEAGLICNLFWSDDPQGAMAYVQNGIDVILTNCAHTLIAGGFRAFGRDPVDPGKVKIL